MIRRTGNYAVCDRKCSFSKVQLLLTCSTDKAMGASSEGLLEDLSSTLVPEERLVAWGVEGSE